jgi:hypothetical protein
MKNLLPISLLVLAMVFLSPGCAWTKRHTPWHHNNTTTADTGATEPAPAPAPKSKAKAKTKAADPNQSQLIVTPDDTLAAKVLSVNAVGRFVVLNFPEGKMPKIDQHMYLYRAGLKTAEVKIAGPQKDTSIVADILSGDAQAGDTVREQ